MTDLDKLRLCAEAVEDPQSVTMPGQSEVWGVTLNSNDPPWRWVRATYNPLTNSDQAMELLCWLNKHGFLPEFDMDGLRFESSAGNSVVLFGDMTSPAALRRAIVDAVVKVKEGK